MAAMRCRISLPLLWALMTWPAVAQVIPPAHLAIVAPVPPGTDSEKAHLLSLLLKGDIDAAISYWGVANLGKQTPAWLLALKTSYDASRQVAGQCQPVARDIHAAFTRFGGKPQFVELTARKGGQAAYIVFRNDKGRDLMVSDNGYHMVVRIEGFAYDAYTGAQGLPWKVYLDRLGSVLKIHEKVIEALPEAIP
jgi:hypothetical protein